MSGIYRTRHVRLNPDFATDFPDFIAGCIRWHHQTTYKTEILVRKRTSSTENTKAGAGPAGVISLLVVSADQRSADDLSQLLQDSRHSIRVEWIKSSRARFTRLIERLSRSSVRIPAIVMLDFRTLGTAIWQLISRCSTLFPDITVEWLVVNHHGSCPRLHESIWQNVTIVGERPTLN